MHKINYLDVCLSPLHYAHAARNHSIIVLIDVFTAGASILAAIANGCPKVLPLADEEQTRAMSDKGYLTAGERGGMQIDGFQFGNSPQTFSKAAISGKPIAFTTTNGTQALDLVIKYNTEHQIESHIVIGSFININSLLFFLQKEGKDVILLCSGWENAVNMEDTLFAGLVASELEKNCWMFASESVTIAKTMYLAAKDNMRDFILNASPRLRSKLSFLGPDIDFCLKKDTYQIIPQYINSHFQEGHH